MERNYPTVYYDIRELVNHKKYLLHGVPATYGPQETYFMSTTSPGPIYTPLRGEKGTCTYTIATIIDMYFNEVDFKFDSAKQMREIERYLGTYIAVMEQDEYYLSREHKEYLNRAKNLFEFLHKKVQKLDEKDREKNLDREKKTNPFLYQVRSSRA